MPWTVRDDGEPIYTKEPGDDFRDVEAGLVDLINERDALVEQLRVAHGVGTIAAAERDALAAELADVWDAAGIMDLDPVRLVQERDDATIRANEAAAERDARSALNDTLIGIINDLTVERDALRRLVNDARSILTAVRESDDLLAIDAAIGYWLAAAEDNQ